jgi:hypothetical protein
VVIENCQDKKTLSFFSDKGLDWVYFRMFENFCATSISLYCIPFVKASHAFYEKEGPTLTPFLSLFDHVALYKSEDYVLHTLSLKLLVIFNCIDIIIEGAFFL